MTEKSDDDFESDILIKEDLKVQRPKRYMVILHNDDYTTMEFVVEVLKKYFAKNQLEAEQVMLQIHQDGQGVGGVYTFEIAETKASQVIRYSREKGHPLRCTIDVEDYL